MKTFEMNFDGLVGPTHNYSGLSRGNVASTSNAKKASNPREAALQGLSKMKFMMGLGLKQAVLPPQERPDIYTLRRLGFEGTDENVLESALKIDPAVLANCCSSSSMWTANAGTVSPSADCSDHKLHITIANLTDKFHRSLERKTTYDIFQRIFADKQFFEVHKSLPSSSQFGDEGAANHNRLCYEHGEPGLEFFVYGKHAFTSGKPKPRHFPARQSIEASQAIARLHKIDPKRVFFAQQNPIAIDAGVFHNDVASVSNQNVLLYHEQAFFDCAVIVDELSKRYAEQCKGDFCPIKVTSHEVTINEAVQTYLFNSQLVTIPDGGMVLICPSECEENRVVRKCVDRVVGNSNNPIRAAHFLNLRQSMSNGGGPACLRLRVVLTEEQMAALGGNVVLDEILFATLTQWVEKHYRDRMDLNDLGDPKLLVECRTALDELTQILKLGSIYSFQRN